MAPIVTSYPELTAPLHGIKTHGHLPRLNQAAMYEPERPTWHLQAACLGYISKGMDYWFATKGDPGSHTKQAKAICAGCPVKDECLADAMLQGPYCVGIWAGTTQDDRKELRVRGTKPGPPRSPKHTAYRYSKHGCRCDKCREAHTRALAKYRARKKAA